MCKSAKLEIKLINTDKALTKEIEKGIRNAGMIATKAIKKGNMLIVEAQEKGKINAD